MMLPRKLHKCHFIAYNVKELTIIKWGLSLVNTRYAMANNTKLCKSCEKEAKTLRHGYCDKCLAIHVVKDWLKKDNVK
jgi:hypothetical protein